MNRDDVIQHLCETIGLVYHTIKDYRYPSNGICRGCPAQAIPGWRFQNSGWEVDFIRQAVQEKLRRDGYKPIEPDFTHFAGAKTYPLPPRESTDI